MQNLMQFYARLLKVKRLWIVTKMRFQTEERVDICVDHQPEVNLCFPQCDVWCPVYDHSLERE